MVNWWLLIMILSSVVRIFHRGGWRAVTFLNNIVHKMSLNENRAFTMDTVTLTRRLEGQSISSHQVEAITYAITEVMNYALQHSSTLFVTKEQLKMSEMIQDDKHSKFRYEIKSLKEDHFSLVLCEIKELKVIIQKIKTELSYQIREATIQQRLELQRERQYFYDELSKQFSEIHKNFKIKMIEDDKLNEFKSKMNVLQEQHVSLIQRKLEEIKTEIKEINNDFRNLHEEILMEDTRRKDLTQNLRSARKILDIRLEDAKLQITKFQIGITLALSDLILVMRNGCIATVTLFKS